ncbi:MAG: hypothetical protein OJF48_003598 [Afipia sp.]|nr:MAG: hypothetical protein OJF48_003598 [Afipia sp.]
MSVCEIFKMTTENELMRFVCIVVDNEFHAFSTHKAKFSR